MFYPGEACFSNGDIVTKDVEEFGPEPFGGVDTADELEIIAVEFGGVGIDGCGLFDCCVVFPEDEECVRVIAERFQEAERGA
jgi:hypothetical protein